MPELPSFQLNVSNQLSGTNSTYSARIDKSLNIGYKTSDIIEIGTAVNCKLYRCKLIMVNKDVQTNSMKHEHLYFTFSEYNATFTSCDYSPLMTSVREHTHTHIYTHAQTHKDTHTHIHRHTHLHAHTHTLTHIKH